MTKLTYAEIERALIEITSKIRNWNTEDITELRDNLNKFEEICNNSEFWYKPLDLVNEYILYGIDTSSLQSSDNANIDNWEGIYAVDKNNNVLYRSNGLWCSEKYDSKTDYSRK